LTIGAAEPPVAHSQELNAILLSFDGAFEVIAPRIPKGHRGRLRKLSRIWMRCSGPQAAERLKKGLDLVSSEYALATAQDAMRMWISAGYFRTER
jgi:hypothetical protein